MTPERATSRTISRALFRSVVGLSIRSLRFAFAAILLLTCSAALNGQAPNVASVSAQEPSAGSFENESFPVTIGFDGHVRLGCWTPILVQQKNEAVDSFQATTLDGDGLSVTYQGSLSKHPELPETSLGWIRIGRNVSQIQLKLFRQSDAPESIEPITVPVDQARIAKSTQPLSLSLGATKAAREAFSLTATGQSDNKDTVIVALDSASEIPADALALQGVGRMLVIANQDVLDQLTPPQVKAIDQWVQQGGQLILSVPGETAAAALGPDGPLAKFAPGPFVKTQPLRDSGILEAFVGSRKRIPGDPESLLLVQMTAQSGFVMMADGNKTLVTRQAHGLGQIVAVAFDLNHPFLSEWSSYTELVRKLCSVERATTDDIGPTTNRSGSVSHYGYTDLSGQLRVGLDDFSNVSFVRFTLIAVLIVAYILLIGPIDYYFLNRVVGKMEWTWVTFPLATILFCLLAWMLSQWTRPSEVQINQLEIIDVDIATGQAQGKIWSNLYSPYSHQAKLTLEPTNPLGFELKESILTWNGLPGDGLGGMQTRPTSSQGEAYRQTIINDDGRLNIEIDDMPMQVSSSRSIIGFWKSDIPFQPRSRPRYDATMDRIVGTIRNPLDADLKNCRLLYNGWAYALGETLEAGGVFDIQTDADEQNLRGHFTQKRSKEGKQKDYSARSSWDPANKRLSRIADILMFHNAAGGVAYTGLTHDYFASLDLTKHLELDRAILIGEVVGPGTQVKCNDDQTVHPDHVTTIVRIIFPVERSSQRTP